MAHIIQHPPAPVTPQKRVPSPQPYDSTPRPTKRPTRRTRGRKTPKGIIKKPDEVDTNAPPPTQKPTEETPEGFVKRSGVVYTSAPFRYSLDVNLKACLEDIEKRPKIPIDRQDSDWKVKHAYIDDLTDEEKVKRRELVENFKRKREEWHANPEKLLAKIRETDPDYRVHSPVPYPSDEELDCCDDYAEEERESYGGACNK